MFACCEVGNLNRSCLSTRERKQQKMGGKMASSHIAHAAYKGPSVVKEILIGIALGIAAGGLWKMHHWNNQRRTKEFYDMLEKGEISVVVDEE
ncbi:cytochrome c oxidase subunit 5C-like isoform X1 [Nicotiana tomentosiformis]|uniref:cytochrome c oxidase subunit 5C-like isoform X1 n=3 Tax=Nicotiana tomentosiformis TaxID=4098 RepID=UPI00051B3608|nr:cytochrome c oxidase subunit 5C-like isoform X1 [Nicotiana tomentosiformis]